MFTMDRIPKVNLVESYDFKQGDVVFMKSGGLAMVVSQVDHTDQTAKCGWQDRRGRLQLNWFRFTSLYKVIK